VVDPDTLAIFGEVYHVDSLLSGPYFLRFRVVDAQRVLPSPAALRSLPPSRPLFLPSLRTIWRAASTSSK
jgi:hypothetical protein